MLMESDVTIFTFINRSYVVTLNRHLACLLIALEFSSVRYNMTYKECLESCVFVN